MASAMAAQRVDHVDRHAPDLHVAALMQLQRRIGAVGRLQPQPAAVARQPGAEDVRVLAPPAVPLATVRPRALDAAALDAFDAIAQREGVALDMMLEPGDAQFASNYTVLHGRTAYEDDPAAPRHMLRLWLELPGFRPLAGNDVRYGHIRHGQLGRTAAEISAPTGA